MLLYEYWGEITTAERLRSSSPNMFIGPIYWNLCGSCCGFQPFLSHRFSHKGLQIGLLDGKTKHVSFKTSTPATKIKTKKLKVGDNTLVIESVFSVAEGVSSVFGNRRMPVHNNANEYKDILSITVGNLHHAITNALGGIKTRHFDWELGGYRSIDKPAATKKQQIQIRKEFRAAVKGHLVAVVYTDEQTKQWEEVKKFLKLFTKKPKYETKWNNLNHPRATNYLTFQLFQY
jgi:hypothetical protein